MNVEGEMGEASRSQGSHRVWTSQRELGAGRTQTAPRDPSGDCPAHTWVSASGLPNCEMINLYRVNPQPVVLCPGSPCDLIQGPRGPPT